MNRQQRRAAAAARQGADFTALRAAGGFKIADAGAFDGLIAVAFAAGFVGRVALLRAVRRRETALLEPDRSTDVPSYRAAIGMALLARRFLLIETDSAHAREWGNALLVQGIPFLGLLPSEGVHPVKPGKLGMQ